MKSKKTLLLALPALSLAFGAVALAFSARQGGLIGAQAADYSLSNRSLSVDESGFHASFNVTDNNLDMKGWLLCLFENKPSYDSNRKLNGSNNLHPFGVEDCKHYFFAASTEKTGTMEVTWAADAADQKQAWDTGETKGEAGKTLADYFDDQDWYIVIGPRHYNSDWAESYDSDDKGAGYQRYWENCDYYVGQKSIVLGDFPDGQIYLDLSEREAWLDAGAKFAVYFWDDNSNSAYSDFASKVDGLNNIYVASYELDFNPTGMLVVRNSPAAEAPVLSGTDFWGQSGDVGFYESGVIGIKEGHDWSNPLATVDGLEKQLVLDHYKRNIKGHSEHYNESVNLKVGDEFVITFNGEACTTYSTLDLIESAFEIHENKIRVKTAGEYAFYFDTTDKSLYITSPTVAAADEWAQTFLGESCTSTKENWEYHADTYASLKNGSKALFSAAEHVGPSVEVEGFIAMAVQRYDYVIALYGTDDYEDFMGRKDVINPTAFMVQGMSQNNRSMVLAITFGAVALTAGVAALMLLAKKRKQR